MKERTNQLEHPPPEQKPLTADELAAIGAKPKCNFRRYEDLCYLKLDRIGGCTEHGRCDGEENCVLFARVISNE